MQLSDDPEAVGFDKQAWLDEHEPYMQVRLEALGTNQERIDDLLTAYSTERRQLEMKYEQLLGTPWPLLSSFSAPMWRRSVCAGHDRVLSRDVNARKRKRFPQWLI